MKKESSDSSIGDLLKKLQSTYMGGKKADKPEKKNQKDEADDQGILAQLKATLDKVSLPETKKAKRTKKAATPKVSEAVIEEPIVEAVEEPIVETVEEPTVEIVEEPTVETVEEPTVETVEEPTAPVAEEPQKRAIKITVKQIPAEEPPKSEPVQEKKPESIVIKPKASASAASAASANDTIVIRPKSVPKIASEPIVIRPRESGSSVARVKPIIDGVSNDAPIKITPMQNNVEKILTVDKAEPTEPVVSVDGLTVEIPEVEPNAPIEAEPVILKEEATPIPEAPVAEESIPSIPFVEVPAESLTGVADSPKKSVKRSPFHLRRKTKPQGDVQNGALSPIEQIHRRIGLSPDDVDMMFELGYENELGRLVGHDTMKKLRYEYLRRNSQSEHRHYRTAFGYRGEEYIKAEQNEKILSAYAHDKKVLMNRVLITALLSFLLFFLDLPNLAGAAIASLDQNAPLLFPILSITTLIATSYFSYRQLYAGARSLMRFTPTPYSIAAVMIPTVLLYSLISLIPTAHAFIPANFLASLLLLTVAIGDVFRLTGEVRAFRIVSSNTDKTVLEPAAPRKRQLRQRNKIVKVINDEIDDRLYRVRAADQTTGFFRRFNALEFAARPILWLLGFSFSIALLAAFVTALFTASFGAAASAFVTMLLCTAPLSMILHAFYPLSRTNSILYRMNCTLVGEESAEEYAQKQTVIFRDSDLYSAEKRTEISVREGDELRLDLRLTEILLRRMGGTLGRLSLFARGAVDDDTSVSFVRIAQGGIEAVVDTQYHVLLGNADFLRRSGIRVPRESTDAEMSRTPDVSVMHVAINGILKLTYELKYTNNDQMESIFSMLAENGTSVAIQSYDPNLCDEFLEKCRPEHLETVTVIRPGRFETDTVQEVVDTGVVALGSRANVALPIHAAKHLSKTRQRGVRLQLLSTAVGTALAIFLTALAPTAAIVPPIIALYHAASCAIAIINTRLSLNSFTLNS